MSKRIRTARRRQFNSLPSCYHYPRHTSDMEGAIYIHYKPGDHERLVGLANTSHNIDRLGEIFSILSPDHEDFKPTGYTQVTWLIRPLWEVPVGALDAVQTELGLEHIREVAGPDPRKLSRRMDPRISSILERWRDG